MAPVTCSYFQCNNKQNEKAMFRFPINDNRRLEKWLLHCGNMTITHLPKEKLRYRCLCIDHFDKDFIRNSDGKRTRLTKLAIPKNYRQLHNITPVMFEPSIAEDATASPELKVLTPKKFYKKSKTISPEPEEENINTIICAPKSRTLKNNSPRTKKLKLAISQTTKQLKKEKAKYKRLQKKNIGQNILNVDKHIFKSRTSKILTCMQLTKKRRQWTDEEKKFCLSLYYKSPSAYKHLLNTGVVLASTSSIQNWLQETNCSPGINKDVFENIKQKYDGKPIKQRACTICFDEMAIMTSLEYIKKYDLIEGFEDYGENERTNSEAKYALVFIARGIYSNWKIPLAYYLAGNPVKGEKLSILIQDIINSVFKSNLLPKAVICDQATTNIKALKMLGVSKCAPFFFVDGRKIFSIFDAPHLIKNFRNNMLEHNFDLNGSEISFKDIVYVYEIEKTNKSRSLNKLTPVHLNPNSFQRMKVKLATQIFSNSVSAAILTAYQSGELKSETANNTADFVKMINDLFDTLNSKNKFDNNPFRCALTKNSNTLAQKTLASANNLLSDLKKVIINKEGEKKFTRPPCFDGMQQTINAILQLSEEEFSKGSGINFLITYRFNQDVIENLFGIYRIKGGCNRNPTARTLRAMFRSQLLNNLIKLNNTNCEDDDDTFINSSNQTQVNLATTSSSNLPRINQTEHENSTILPVLSIQSNLIISSPCNLEDEDVTGHTSLEKCSVVYFAGWLGKKSIEKFNCADCKDILLNDNVDLNDKKQLLLINKTYSNIATPTLKSPSDFLYQLVDKLLTIFHNHIESLAPKRNIINNLKTILKNEFSMPTYHNNDHLNYLIEKLYEVKIHDYCKKRKRSAGGSSKVRILQHK